MLFGRSRRKWSLIPRDEQTSILLKGHLVPGHFPELKFWKVVVLFDAGARDEATLLPKICSAMRPVSGTAYFE